MSYIKLTTKYLKNTNDLDVDKYQTKIKEIHNNLHDGKVQGSDYLGWITYPVEYNVEEFVRLDMLGKKIRKTNSILVVIGIGGSYLGAKAGLEFLKGYKKPECEVLFAGFNMSSLELSNLLEYLQDKDFYINVVSKSGTTLEPGISFRFLKQLLEKKCKNEYKERIIVTTDEKNGILRQNVLDEGYQSFIIPANIGGRYSVLTPVGMLAFAAAGYDIEKIMQGAKHAYQALLDSNVLTNDCYMHAAIRHHLYTEKKVVDLFVTNEIELSFISEWYKQLFAESEGKDRKGLFPASINLTTDLHSLGQFIQEGPNVLFETVLELEKPSKNINMFALDDDFDKLNYLQNKTLFDINKTALHATLEAHNDGGVPIVLIKIPEVSPYSFGYLTYYFMKMCAISGNLLDINVFNQPGVEAYKKNMFKKLGRNN